MVTTLAALALVLADQLPGAALAAVAVAAVADVLPERGPRWATAGVAALVLAMSVRAVHDYRWTGWFTNGREALRSHRRFRAELDP